ncbi:MAG: potassium transporter TrkG [Sandaracinaceae bacterium]
MADGQRILRVSFRALNLAVSVSAVATIAYYHGFAYHPGHMAEHGVYLHTSLVFYHVLFVVRAARAPRVREYLRAEAPEAFVLATVVAMVAVNWATDSGLARLLATFTGADAEHGWVLVLHLWLLLIVGMELARVVATSTALWVLSAARLFIASFAVLVVVGAVLLMLPEMSQDATRLSFVDALFTSTSAACVTGLAVVDTATRLSAKGQLLVLVLIQLGGLNIIFFATFFITRYAQAETPESDAAVSQLLQTQSLTADDTRAMMKRVIGTALGVELVGAVLLHAASGREGSIFSSGFHAVSAFNNAGFSVYPSGLENPSMVSNPAFQAVVALLIVVGGMGFTTIWDLARLRSSSLGSRVAIGAAVVLIPVGALLLFVLEFADSSPGASTGLGAAAFHSVSARTAGFSTVNIGSLGLPALILLMLLMFVGASSGSTGGGIKTSTTAVLGLVLARRLRLTESALFSCPALVRRAGMILLCSVAVVAVGTGALLMTEPGAAFEAVLFEEVSAFATVGLSTGLTPALSSAGKAVVMATMFIGRIGPLSLGYALMTGSQEPSDDGAIMVG